MEVGCFPPRRHRHGCRIHRRSPRGALLAPPIERLPFPPLLVPPPEHPLFLTGCPGMQVGCANLPGRGWTEREVVVVGYKPLRCYLKHRGALEQCLTTASGPRPSSAGTGSCSTLLPATTSTSCHSSPSATRPLTSGCSSRGKVTPAPPALPHCLMIYPETSPEEDSVRIRGFEAPLSGYHFIHGVSHSTPAFALTMVACFLGVLSRPTAAAASRRRGRGLRKHPAEGREAPRGKARAPDPRGSRRGPTQRSPGSQAWRRWSSTGFSSSGPPAPLRRRLNP